MAKGSRGGQRAGGTLSAGGGSLLQNQQNQQSQQPQVDNTQTASDFSTDYKTFMAMDDDAKADVINNALKQGVPDHLSQTDFQKFIYNTGLNDKPDVVDDATLNNMTGTEIFRTVNNVYDRQNDISYSADQIAKQVIAGRVTRTSDNGGSVYGRGIYFANNKADSTAYGNTRGNVKKTAVIRGKLNNNAKVIDYNKALRGALKKEGDGTKLGTILSKVDSASMVSIYAMTQGYNVISNGRTYLNVLNRNAVTMSKSINSI